MREYKCLICNSPSPPLPPPNATTSNVLAQQLRAIFLLRNIFELPSCILQKYLLSGGGGHNPSQWFSVCRECDPLVQKMRFFYEQFVEADRKFKRAKYELVRKMKESAASPRTLSKPLPPGFTNCVCISEECLQFVQLHDYDEPPKNPFSEGDHRAREMLGVAVDVDLEVGHLNVKTEVLESTENHLQLENVDDLYQNHHTAMDLGGSHGDLSFTPEGHDYEDYDDSEDGGGGGGGYLDDDDDYVYLPPGPKCRKREAKLKSESTKTQTKNAPDLQDDERTAAKASNLIQFLTTTRGKRMVSYDGHNFYKVSSRSARGGSNSGMAHFHCKWSREGCPVKISFRNYNEEDASYTGFVPNLEAHDHSAAPTGQRATKQGIWYEINSLAKEIVKDNVNASASQVIQMVQDSFLGDPEVTQELSKEKVQSNMRKLIGNMKRRLGYKPKPGRRRFIGTKLITTKESVPKDDGDGSQPEVKNHLNSPPTEMKELTSAEASDLIQFLTTTRGKRMVRYEGHNFYKVSTRSASGCSISGVTHFDCKLSRNGCPARIGLRNYSEEDGSYTSFIPNADSHHHDSAAGGAGGDVTKKNWNRTHPMWYEVNSLAKEIVKDNVNAPASQVLQMLQDSFMGDPEVTKELSKENVQNNLRKLIANMKRRLGWKPDANVKLKRARISRKRRQGLTRPFVGHSDKSALEGGVV